MLDWFNFAQLPLLAVEDGAAADAPGNVGIFETFLRSGMLPFVVIGVLFYLMLIQPERRKRAQMTRLLDGLKKNDRVVTIGGIVGVVVSTDKDEIVVRVDENNNTRLRLLRSAVTRVLESDKGDDKAESS